MPLHQHAYDTLDRVRDLLIKWKADERIDDDLVEYLDYALSNGIGDNDTWKWLDGIHSSAFRFYAVKHPTQTKLDGEQ